MKKLIRILGILLCAAMIVPAVPVSAKRSKDYWPKIGEKISASSAILMDLDTGTILYQKKIDKTFYPASITKILTTLIAIENSTMDEVVTFSEDAIYNTEGSGIWRDIGEKMTMEQCLYAIMLESANECAYAVAEHIAGSLSGFVDMMNEKAKELGCTASHFNNPHGLPDENHYVSARDMALIAKAAYENETFRLICGTKRYTIPPTNKHTDPTYLQNHHLMLNSRNGETKYLYEYCTGGKTGYTQAAGNTLVTFAQKDDMTLVAVILAGSSPAYWGETRALLDFGFDNFNVYNVAENEEEGSLSEEQKYDTLNVNAPYAKIDPEAKIVLPKTVDFDNAVMDISYENLPEDALAQLKFSYAKHEVGTADVIRTNVEIEKDGLVLDTTKSGETVTEEDTPEEEAEQNDGETTAVSSFFKKLKNSLTNKKIVMALVSVLAGVIILILALFLIFSRSYVMRQRISNYRNRKRESRKYKIIRDNTKKRWWGKRR